jgi:hypothetical protein
LPRRSETKAGWTQRKAAWPRTPSGLYADGQE